MSALERAAWQVLELCERIIDGKEVWSLSDMREDFELLRAALEQAEPVDKPLTNTAPLVDKEQADSGNPSY